MAMVSIGCMWTSCGLYVEGVQAMGEHVVRCGLSVSMWWPWWAAWVSCEGEQAMGELVVRCRLHE